MKSLTKEQIIESMTYIFENTKRIHGNSEAIDWIKVAIHKSAEYITQESEEKKTADVYKFSDRLDEIFKQGMPTKAQIIDAFNKFSGQSMPELTDLEIEYSHAVKCLSSTPAHYFSRGAKWYRSEIKERMK